MDNEYDIDDDILQLRQRIAEIEKSAAELPALHGTLKKLCVSRNVAGREAFHLANGLWFMRLASGEIKVEKRAADTVGTVEWSCVASPEGWCSALAFLSKRDDVGEAWTAAMDFHFGASDMSTLGDNGDATRAALRAKGHTK